MIGNQINVHHADCLSQEQVRRSSRSLRIWTMLRRRRRRTSGPTSSPRPSRPWSTPTVWPRTAKSIRASTPSPPFRSCSPSCSATPATVSSSPCSPCGWSSRKIPSRKSKERCAITHERDVLSLKVIRHESILNGFLVKQIG